MAKQPRTDGEPDDDGPGMNGHKRGGMIRGHKEMAANGKHGHKPLPSAGKHGHKAMKKPRGA